MMITHNMKDAIKYGNRLIMMHEGHIIYDVAGEEKKNLHVPTCWQSSRSPAAASLPTTA